MVLNSSVVAAVANLSANLCQYIACNPQRFSGDQVLYLLFCYPCQSLRPSLLSIWACLCFPPLTSSSESESDSDLSDSHSD
ncbi:hypothetical protein CDL15_Pgr001341 [Punica granatum]|uniref:Uncharacterized protein n=1 Tax=Punica granatum TaxID=22663 RepID=A0A218WK70_PUNGR|nr:hypothetical protein CDL15_Pgr001341 [Punica granatum]